MNFDGLDFKVDMVLIETRCAACGEHLVDGTFVGTLGDAGIDEPWCFDCMREIFHARADSRAVPMEHATRGTAGSGPET
jgi:hypothetical protein